MSSEPHIPIRCHRHAGKRIGGEPVGGGKAGKAPAVESYRAARNVSSGKAQLAGREPEIALLVQGASPDIIPNQAVGTVEVPNGRLIVVRHPATSRGKPYPTASVVSDSLDASEGQTISFVEVDPTQAVP